jgi:hypothetical protein
MKKFFIALSLLAVLVFTGTPSMALVGTPDAVPGTDILQPFFLVSIDGGLDTLVAITEVKGIRSSFHWQLFDRMSVHVINDVIGYTPFDVVPISVRGLLAGLSDKELDQLAVDLDNDGILDHYMGYMTFTNNWRWRPGVDPVAGRDYDNLIAHQYVVDLFGGIASGVVLPGRELAQRDAFTLNLPQLLGAGWWFTQNSRLNLQWMPGANQFLPWPEFTDYEVFTPFAYAYSKGREQLFFVNQWLLNPGIDINDLRVVPSHFRLLPRYFIRDGFGDSWVFIWTNGNWGQYEDGPDADNYRRVVNVWDEEENAVSKTINIPYELNYIYMRDILPRDLNPARAFGGWVDIRWDYEFRNLPINDFQYPWFNSLLPLGVEWLAYSYQVARTPDAGLNWAALFEVHRDVGTVINPLWQ